MKTVTKYACGYDLQSTSGKISLTFHDGDSAIIEGLSNEDFSLITGLLQGSTTVSYNSTAKQFYTEGTLRS
jgi:hypothetical protein